MSTTYYPLIGIDWNHNEKQREWPGINYEDAARSMGERYGLSEVVSNYIGQKRGGNGSGMYNRKPLWKAAVPPSGSLKPPSANPTLSEVLTQQADVLNQRILEKTLPLINSLRARGLEFKLVNGNGTPILRMEPTTLCSVTNKELGQIRDLVRENKNHIISVLEAEAKPSKPQEPPVPTDPLKGKKIQDILLSMLPQMPTPFTVADLADRLRAAGYTEFAADRTRLTSSIHYAIIKEQIETAGRGRYRVKEEYRHRRAASEHPLREAYESAVGGTPEKEPVIEAITPDPQPELPLESLQPPRDVIEVPAPPEPQPEREREPASPAIDARQALVATVLDLASQAAAGDDELVLLADKVDEAFAQFENSTLDALATLGAAVKPFVAQIRRRAAAKQALLRSLSDQKL